MQKIEVLVKWIFTYLRHIKTPRCHMVVIAIKHYLTWPCQQCVYIYTIPTRIATLKMCVALLLRFPTYLTLNPRTIYASLQRMPYNTFSCLSLNFILCSAWKMPSR